MTDRLLQNLGDWRAARKDMRGIWRTLGYTQEEWEVGRSVVSWDAPEDYASGVVARTAVSGADRREWRENIAPLMR